MIVHYRRSLGQLTSGFQAAPFGTVAVAFLKVVGLRTLSEWDPAVAAESVRGRCLVVSSRELQTGCGISCLAGHWSL